MRTAACSINLMAVWRRVSASRRICSDVGLSGTTTIMPRIQGRREGLSKTKPTCVFWFMPQKVYGLTISFRGKTEGRKAAKEGPKFDPFLTTGAKDRMSP
jgi:hypothetical protein